MRQAGARPGTWLSVTGAAVLLAALGAGVVSVARIASLAVGTAQRLVDEPVRQGPFDAAVGLEPGSWVVYARAGAPDLAAGDVTVTAPDGGTLAVRPADGVTITREGREYRGLVSFPVEREGPHRVVVRSDAAFVLAPGLGSILGRSVGWVVAGLVAALAFVVGTVLLVAGLVLLYRGRRGARTAGDAEAPAEVSGPAGPPHAGQP
jgi:hypothetical protein